MASSIPHGRQGSRGVGGPRLVAISLLVVLLLSLQISAPRASLNILWRFSILSFDNPATQVLDELALEKTPFTNALEELLAVTRLVAGSSRSSLARPAPGFTSTEVRSGRTSRSPPVA